MNSLRIIDIENGSLLYSAFSLIAFLAGLLVLVIEGQRRKFPMLQWLLFVATSFLFFIAGAQVIKFSGEDWQRVFQFNDLNHFVGRSLLGGILLAIPGLLLAKYFLRFHYNPMDAFAWAAPLSLLIQRIGCQLAGCCFGTPTSASWGVQYGSNSHAYHQHVQNHLISTSQQLSLAIHPVALYEAAGCILIMFILNRVKRYIKVSGNLFLTSLMMYACLRFATEFFRAGSARFQYFDGLTIIQVALLILIPIIVAAILYRERKFNSGISFCNAETASIKPALPYFFILMTAFVLVSRWLAFVEILTFTIIMIPAFLYMSWHVFKILTIPSMRLTTLLLIACSMMLMSQTLPETSPSDTTRHAYNIFSLGAMTGSSDFNINDVTYDCDGNITSSTVSNVLHNSFSVNGAGYTRVEEYGNGESIQYGVDAYWGTHSETNRNMQTNTTTIKTLPISGIHPFVQYDWRLIGVGAGVHIGTMSMLTIPQDNGYSFLPTTVKEINVLPSAYFRIGYVNRFFGELKIAQQFPAPFPATVFQTNIGIGFPRKKGAAIRFGTSTYAGLIIAPSLPLGNHFIFEPYVAGLPGLFSGRLNDQVDHTSTFVGSFTLRYKFGMNVRR